MAKYKLRLFYTTTVSAAALPHTLGLYVNVTSSPTPGALFTDITVTEKDGGTQTLATYVDTLFDFIKVFYHTTSDFIRWELWRADDAESEDYTFIAVDGIALPGTSANATVVTQQNTITLRAVDGRSGRIQFMESVLGGNSLEAFPTANTAVNNLTAHIIDINSCVVNKYGAFFVVGIHLASGSNEALFKKRFRNV